MIDFGIFADRNAAGASTGETTGGWVRDLMRNLMSVIALQPAQLSDPTNYADFVEGMRQGFDSAERALSQEAGALGQVTARMDQLQRRHRETSDVLRRQVASIEEVDLAATIERLQATRIGLEASYRAISTLSDLTLSRFLR